MRLLRDHIPEWDSTALSAEGGAQSRIENFINLSIFQNVPNEEAVTQE